MLSMRIGRKKNLMLGCAVAVIADFLLLFMVSGVVISQVVFIIYLTFYYFIGNTAYCYVPELFPTKVRSTAVSYSKVPAKLILVVFPFFIKDSLTIMIMNLFLMAFIPFVLLFTKETLVLTNKSEDVKEKAIENEKNEV